MLRSQNALLTTSAISNLRSSRGAAKGVRIANPSADFAPFKGKDWLKKPIKVHLEAGKAYKWCSCGLGIEQPWCDSHQCKRAGVLPRPVEFSVEKTGDYFLCACKQTEHRPLCDGAHKTIDQRPKWADASERIMHAELSPVYDVEGVAWKLGYRPKEGHLKG